MLPKKLSFSIFSEDSSTDFSFDCSATVPTFIEPGPSIIRKSDGLSILCDTPGASPEDSPIEGVSMEGDIGRFDEGAKTSESIPVAGASEGRRINEFLVPELELRSPGMLEISLDAATAWGIMRPSPESNPYTTQNKGKSAAWRSTARMDIFAEPSRYHISCSSSITDRNE